MGLQKMRLRQKNTHFSTLVGIVSGLVLCYAIKEDVHPRRILRHRA